MHKLLKYTLISLAIAGLVFAIFAFFFPVKSNFISGYLDNGSLYTKEWFTYSYEVVGGYLLLLAAASCIYASTQFNKESADARELVFWAGLSVILIVSLYLAGNTLFISWLPGVPTELQSALGTRYVDYKVAPVRNLPQILSSVLLILFALVAVVAVFIFSLKKSEKSDSSDEAKEIVEE